jgi:tRNA 2-thiouridine synthesizing protein A
MKIEVDARGLSCPQPVILAKKAIDDGKFPVEINVDTVTARENVRRLAENSGCKIQVEDTGEDFKLILNK